MSNKIIILCAVISVSIFCLALISLTAGAPGGSQGASAPLDLGYVPGELLVRFAPKTNGIQRSTAEKNQILSSLGEATVERDLRIVPGLSLVKLPAGVMVEEAAADENMHMPWADIQSPLVKFLEPMVESPENIRSEAREVVDLYGRYNPEKFRCLWEKLRGRQAN